MRQALRNANSTLDASIISRNNHLCARRHVKTYL